MKKWLGGFLVFWLIGCATAGPFAVSPKVYRGIEKKVVARENAKTAYYKAQGESYEAGGAGEVISKRSLFAPEFYHDGVLVNRRHQPVTFMITGKLGVTEMVDAMSLLPIRLPPGAYWVQIYAGDSSWPYRRGQVVIDRQTGDSVLDGNPYDFVIMAP